MDFRGGMGGGGVEGAMEGAVVSSEKVALGGKRRVEDLTCGGGGAWRVAVGAAA